MILKDLLTILKNPENPLIAAIAGAVMGALMGIVVNLLMNRYRLWKLTRKLKFRPRRKAGSRGSAMIDNGYIYPISGAFAYITIDHNLDDVLMPPEPFTAYITKEHLTKVVDERLCWSVTMPFDNPPEADIYAGSSQPLDIVGINNEKNLIEIPSEKGWATSQGIDDLKQLKESGNTDKIRKSRVFLKTKKYKATIKIVSKDTKAKKFKILIDPYDQEMPIKLRKWWN